MTVPDPLREDEVEAVAKAIQRSQFRKHNVLWSALYPDQVADFMSDARAAIIRLDELRGK